MALLAETVVEEWLMRNGYFTIRGLKIGIHEMDILAIKNVEGGWKNIHVEVQSCSIHLLLLLFWLHPYLNYLARNM